MENRHFPDWLDAYMEYTDKSEPPESFRLWNGISTIAACLQRKVCLVWGADLVFYPNLYVLLVGPSGSRKSTSMRPAQAILRDKGVKVASDAITSEALIQEVEASGNTSPMPDGTPFLHSSITVYSEEFTVFIGYQNMQMLANLCDWHDAKEQWKYTTKHQGVNVISGVWVNLMGATTPELLQSTLPRDAIGGGLTARMIMVYEPKKGKSVSRTKVDERSASLRQRLVDDLDSMLMMMGEFNTTNEFIERWDEWYKLSDTHPPFNDDRFSGYIDRRPAHLLKLSMIISASRSSSMMLELRDFDRALTILTNTEKRMAYAFTGVGKSKNADTLVRVLQYMTGKHECTRFDLAQRFYYDADRRVLDDVLSTLVSMGAIKMGMKGMVQVYSFIKNTIEDGMKL